MDVVRRYPIDGIHFDDYFYPYPVRNMKFHDENTFAQFSRGIKNLKDWRRDNINLFVKGISDSINKEKPGLKFGISPPVYGKIKAVIHWVHQLLVPKVSVLHILIQESGLKKDG
jgi:uncharacterized lipoprotein YddW (UPF0748 family)